MDALLHDLRFALRSALRMPGSTALMVLTLAVGIGANALMFSVVRGVLLRPLPYPQPERLVRIWETAPSGPDEIRSIAHPTLADWQPGLRSFERLALFGPHSVDLAGDGRPEQIAGTMVSGDFFRVLGVAPARGRDFTRDELLPGGPRVILLGDALWRRRFGGDPAVLGRSLTLSGQSFTVVGIMPPGFAYPRGADFWVSTGNDAEYDKREARHLSAIARLRPGVDVEQATAELQARERELGRRLPDNYRNFGVRLFPLREWIVRDSRPALTVLFAAVGAVLLIACANLANLMLHRALRRERELAVRTALGAGALRVMRHLLAESVFVSALGGALGLAVAAGGLRLFRVAAAERFPRMDEVTLDGRVLLFTAAVAIGSGLVVGLLPALHALSPRLHALLKSTGRTQSADPSRWRLRAALVVAQTAVAVALLVVAGVLVRTLWQLGNAEPGLATERLLTFGAGLPPAREGDAPYVVDFYRRLQERLAAVPGAVDVGFASRLPLSGEDHSTSFHFLGEPESGGPQRSAQDRVISPGWFRALHVPVRGRELAATDSAEAPPVAMVNEAFARRWFAGRDAIGQWIVPGQGGHQARQIVGVAGDTRQFGLDTPAEPEIYIPHAQDPWPWVSVVVRTRGEPRALLPSIERAVWSLQPDMPLTEVRTMQEMQAATLQPRRWNALLLAAFAAIALTLASVGTYSVMAYLVGERRRELGIRLALGAAPQRILASTLRQGLRLALAGTLLGALAAAGATRALRTLLFGVEPLDPATFISVAVLVAAAVVLASLLPARRAAALDPVQTLRE
ncbi:MAG TPA: ABC transporter permease [Thermoanaerobaculia bacterium]|jgi:putative ABC transport system permease protein|nr:ABC transporter permease [Thermoanaerobaculia bacterium]